LHHRWLPTLQTASARSSIERKQASTSPEGGRDFTGRVLIDRDTATGTSIAMFFYFSPVNVVCDNGTPDDPTDDFDNQDLIDFTANEAPPATLTIASNLSASSASATASGNRIHLVACTDTRTSEPDTVAWNLSMQATGPASRTSEVDHFPNEDGTATTQSVKIASRPAAGTITIDGATYQLRDASISHILVVLSTH
jgi:hypothetical protein